MDKKTLILLIVAVCLIAVAGKFLLFPTSSGTSLKTSTGQAINVQTSPSETLKSYSDPSGFTFNYPDNLSLTKNDLTDASYAEVQLSAKGVAGSLNLKITDSKFKTLTDWLNSNKVSQDDTKEVKLGSLKAIEAKLADKLILGALDQGVLFAIEIPAGEKDDFWQKVYDKILADFSFAPPVQENSAGDSSADDITFDGEEVVE